MFREPGQGMSNAAKTTFGCLAVLVGCFLIFGHLFFSEYGGVLLNSLWVSLGLSIVFQGTAELLLRDRATLAGWLRVAAPLQTLLLVVIVIATISHNL